MYISQNLRYLRKKLNLTQSDLAERLGLNRPVIGAYEEGRAEPRIQTLQMMSEFFKYSIDQLINTDLSTGAIAVDASGKSLRILPIAIDSKTEKERVTLVPVKAAAGYLAGYGDIEYIASLPNFSMPFPELPADRTYRIFQIQGDSMLPILPKSYVVCEYVQDWTLLKNYERYIFLTANEGIVFKRTRVLSEDKYEMISDNPLYEPYTVNGSDILEVWRARGVMSFDLKDITAEKAELKTVMEAIEKVEKRVKNIEQKLSNN